MRSAPAATRTLNHFLKRELRHLPRTKFAFCSLCLKMLEPFLPARQNPKGDGGNEIDTPPRRRSLTLAQARLVILVNLYPFTN